MSEQIEKLMKLASEYAHCYAFVGDDTMPLKRAELQACAEIMQAEIDKRDARIAQLEEALKMMLEAGESKYGEDWFVAARNGNSALSTSPNTWLAEHDKKVEVNVLEDIFTNAIRDGCKHYTSDDVVETIKYMAESRRAK